MNIPNLNPNIRFVRHAPVADQYRKVCYGRSDVPLGPEGEQQSHLIADQLVALGPQTIIHSGLQRTRFLAEILSDRLGCTAIPVPDLQERDFGNWEMRAWDDIHTAHGDEMMRMITEPDTYRPGGGETTYEVRDRVLDWYLQQATQEGMTIVIAHGGPIATLRGSLLQLPVSRWVELIPKCGDIVLPGE